MSGRPCRQDSAARPARVVARRSRRDELPARRAPRSRVHVLPPGARRRRADRADAPRGRRPDDARDRQRVSRRRADDGAAARAREAEDPDGGDPVPGPARPARCSPTGSGRCSRCSTSFSTRATRRRPGLCSCATTSAPRRSGSTKLLVRADARRAGGVRAAGADAAARLPPRRSPLSGRELVLLHDQDRDRWDARSIDEGLRMLDRAAALRRPGPYQLQAAIAGIARRRHGLEGDRRCVRPAAPARSVPRRTAEPRRRDRPRRRRRAGPVARRRRHRARRLPAVSRGSRRPPAPTRAARRGRPTPTAGRSRSPTSDPERRFLERRLHEVVSES